MQIYNGVRQGHQQVRQVGKTNVAGKGLGPVPVPDVHQCCTHNEADGCIDDQTMWHTRCSVWSAGEDPQSISLYIIYEATAQ